MAKAAVTFSPMAALISCKTAMVGNQQKSRYRRERERERDRREGEREREIERERERESKLNSQVQRTTSEKKAKDEDSYIHAVFLLNRKEDRAAAHVGDEE
jgi:SRSO17 transposase